MSRLLGSGEFILDPDTNPWVAQQLMQGFYICVLLSSGE